MGGVTEAAKTTAQGPTLLQMMAEQTKYKQQMVSVGQGKKKRIGGGVKASRLGIGINEAEDFQAPEKRQPNKKHHGTKVSGGFTDGFGDYKHSSHSTQNAIKRY
mgnify:CR=1 FL=1